MMHFTFNIINWGYCLCSARKHDCATSSTSVHVWIESLPLANALVSTLPSYSSLLLGQSYRIEMSSWCTSISLWCLEETILGLLVCPFNRFYLSTRRFSLSACGELFLPPSTSFVGGFFPSNSWKIQEKMLSYIQWSESLQVSLTINVLWPLIILLLRVIE